RPHRCITLRAGIGGTGNGEWSLFLKQFFKTIVGRAHHLHAVTIMSVPVRAPGPIEIMAHVIGEVASSEHCPLVHVVPYTGYAGLHQLLEQAAPPVAHFFVGEIRKLAATRPHVALHEIIISTAAEIAVFLPFLERPVVFVYLDTRVDDHYGTEAIIS